MKTSPLSPLHHHAADRSAHARSWEDAMQAGREGSIGRAYLIGWVCCTLYALLQTQIIVVFEADVEYLMVLPGSLICAYLYGLLAIGAWFWTVRILFGRPPLMQIIGHLTGAIVYAVVWYALYASLFILLFGEEIFELAQISTYSPWMMSTSGLVYGILAGVFYTRRYRREVIERAIREKDLVLRTSQMELAVLKSQMNPHFLFNTLNTVNALIGSNPERARSVVARLGEILRYSLESDRRPLVRLEEELRFVERYLEIERERFGARVRTAIDADRDVLDLLVPPMIIQPLVENAIRHGLAPKENGGSIAIRAHLSDERLHVEVADDGAGAGGRSAEELLRAGCGLFNTDQRLQKMFDGASALDVKSGSAGSSAGFTVRFSMPAIVQEMNTQPLPTGDYAASITD